MNKSTLQLSQEAFAMGRWQEARDLLDQELKKKTSPEALEEMARACWWLKDFANIFYYRMQAYEAFIQSNNTTGAARIAGWLGMDYLEIKGELAIANGWFQRASHLLQDAGDCWERAFITLLHARLCFMQHSTNELALQLVDESLSISKRVGSTEGEMMATGVKGLILTTEGKIREAVGYLDEATLLATTGQIRDITIAGITCCILIEACQRIRDIERAGQWCNQIREMAHRWHFDTLFTSCRTQYASMLIWKGEWQIAEHELMSMASEIQQMRPLHATMLLVQIADLRRKQGRWKETRELLQQAQNPFVKLPVSAAFAYDQGEFRTAADMVIRYLRQIPAKEKTGREFALELLIRIYSQEGRIEDGINTLNELKELAEIMDTDAVKASFLICSGIVQQAVGNASASKANFEDGIDIYDTIGVPFESASARMLLSDVLICLRQYRNAEVELNKAVRAFEKVGAEKELEKAKRLLKTLRRQQSAESRSEALEYTDRELDILRLLSEGKNNKEIAQHLFISVRTVEKHLANLYVKMGVYGKSARAFAASLAIKKHLFDKGFENT